MKIVQQFEGNKLQPSPDGPWLNGKEDIHGVDMKISFYFHKDKLIQIVYYANLGETGDPFAQHRLLCGTLEDKYGRGKAESDGDLEAGFRRTKWDTPKQNVELSAYTAFYPKRSRTLFLTYKSKLPELKEYELEKDRIQKAKDQEREKKIKEKF